jgi:hypothetical protein
MNMNNDAILDIDLFIQNNGMNLSVGAPSHPRE